MADTEQGFPHIPSAVMRHVALRCGLNGADGGHGWAARGSAMSLHASSHAAD